MKTINKPVLTKSTENKAIINMGDRDIIVTRLLLIEGCEGFTACEKLHQPRILFKSGRDNKEDQYSYYPRFPKVFKEQNGSMVVPSIAWAFNYVSEKYNAIMSKKDRG